MSWRVAVQIVVILFIATLGEHHISGKGYYHYTSNNEFIIGRVALWIPFLWVFIIQCAFCAMMFMGVTGLVACVGSGLAASLFDFIVVEPYLSGAKGLWLWKPVSNGYFSFMPTRLNRFTAPFGNYLVWLLFPALANYLLVILLVLFPYFPY